MVLKRVFKTIFGLAHFLDNGLAHFLEVHGIKPTIEPELLNGTYHTTLDISEDGGWTLLTWNFVDYYKKKATCAIIII